MSEHVATVRWQRDDSEFTTNRFSRAHEWAFDGGARVPASAAPAVLPPPLSEAAHVDPEEALVAALSSCHMLCFLHIAASAGFVVDSYVDHAVGELGRNERGRLAVTRVTLRPRAQFSGAPLPSAAELLHMHHRAHDRCFIANSVRTDVLTEPHLTHLEGASGAVGADAGVRRTGLGS